MDIYSDDIKCLLCGSGMYYDFREKSDSNPESFVAQCWCRNDSCQLSSLALANKNESDSERSVRIETEKRRILSEHLLLPASKAADPR